MGTDVARLAAVDSPPPVGVEAARLPGVRRIAVLRCNAVGDYLMSTPALAALKATYPGAEVTLLAGRWHAEFLRGRPGPVDRVLVLPQVPGLAGQPSGAPPAAQLPAFLTARRAERFDLALQLHGGGVTSTPLVQELGARCTAGLRAGDAPPLDRSTPYRYYQPEVFRYLDAVGLVGATGPAEYPELTVTAAERAAGAALLPAGHRPWIAMHVGATDPRRRWSLDRFAELAEELSLDGVRVVLTGGVDDARAAAAVLARTGAPVLDITGRTSLGVLAGVLQRCALLIGNDSGPVHLARAVGTPTVGLYWCGNGLTAAPLSRTRDRPLLSWTVHCPECGADCTPAGHPHRPGDGCAHRPSFLDQIPVAEVLGEARDLLAGAGAGLPVPTGN